MLLQHQAIEMIALFKEQHILISAIQDKTLSPSQNFPIRRNLKRALTVNSCDPFPHPALQFTCSMLYVMFVKNGICFPTF